MLLHKNHLNLHGLASLREPILQELEQTYPHFLTALTLMRGGRSMMEKLEVFHIHRQATTAALIMLLLKKIQRGLMDQLAQILLLLVPILVLMLWNTAQILMRDSLFLTERLEPFPTHSQVITAVTHTLLPNLIDMTWGMLQLQSLALRDAQMSWTVLICSRMERLEQLHIQNPIITAGNIKMELLFCLIL